MILFNEDNTGGLLSTKDGPLTFSIKGNEVVINETKDSHRLDGHSLDDMTFEYMYDPANNEAFSKWNPGAIDGGIFHINPKTQLIGMYLEIIDREDSDRNFALEIYRKDVGSLMEILFCMASLGETLCDADGNSYKFATLIGVSDVFERFSMMLQHPVYNASFNYMIYIAGQIQAHCEVDADTPEQMLDIINEVTLRNIA